MKTRAEIKAIAKENFKANYWPLIGITVLVSVLTSALCGTGIGFLLTPALTVGLTFVYIAAFFGDKENASMGNVFNVGFAKFGRNLGSILLQGLLICLWCMLLYIPGIIKAFAYSMAPYILADCPEVGAVDAITLSRRMMKGHKWEFFVFNLSFIGWIFLSIISFGLVAVFYAGPYMSVACAGYYVELKKLSIETGVVTAEQFAGAPLDGSAPAPAAEFVASEVVEPVAEFAETEAAVVEEAVVEEAVAVEEAVEAVETEVVETVTDENTEA